MVSPNGREMPNVVFIPSRHFAMRLLPDGPTMPCGGFSTQEREVKLSGLSLPLRRSHRPMPS
jgi:hypothetical protein